MIDFIYCEQDENMKRLQPIEIYNDGFNDI